MNCIITLATGYRYEQIQAFFVSARRAGLTARIYLIRSPKDADVREAAIKDYPNTTIVKPFQMRFSPFTIRSSPLSQAASYGLAQIMRPLLKNAPTLFEKTADLMACTLHPMVSRYIFARDILKANPQISKVMLTDIRDVIFQRDPFEDVHDKLHTGLEDKLMNKEPNNIRWVFALTHDFATLQRLLERTIICAGVSLGPADVVRQYLDEFTRQCVASWHRIKSIPAYDQGLHNFVLSGGHTTIPVALEPLGSSLLMTVSNEWEKYWTLDEQRGVLGQDGRPVAIVHQFDRKHRLIEYFEKQFSLKLPVSAYAS
jgi:hypothetical protein